MNFAASTHYTIFFFAGWASVC